MGTCLLGNSNWPNSANDTSPQTNMSKDQKPPNAFKAFIIKIDANGNSFIEPKEFKNLMEIANEKFEKKLTDEQIQEATDAMDKDGDGRFSVKEVSDWLVTAGYLNKTDGLGGIFDSIWNAVGGDALVKQGVDWI